MKARIFNLILIAWAIAYALTACSMTTKDGTTFAVTPEAVRVVQILSEK